MIPMLVLVLGFIGFLVLQAVLQILYKNSIKKLFPKSRFVGGLFIWNYYIDDVDIVDKVTLDQNQHKWDSLSFRVTMIYSFIISILVYASMFLIK